MKNKMLIILTALLIVMPGMCSAVTIGNPVEVQGELLKYAVGFEYETVSGRDLDLKSGLFHWVEPTAVYDTVYTKANFKNLEIDGSNRIFVKGAIGVHSLIDVYVKLGLADINWKGDWITGGSNLATEFESDMGLMYGIGANGKIYELSNGLKFSADAQYLSFKSDTDVTYNGVDYGPALINTTSLGSYSSLESETTVDEIQFAIAVSKKMDKFNPYGGIKYSNITIENNIELIGIDSSAGNPAVTLNDDVKVEADNNIGVFIGSDYCIIEDKLSVNLEARLIDESSLSLGVNYRF